jgi:hypothetical protein
MLLPYTLIGQSNDYEWVNNAECTSNHFGRRCTSDINGNIIGVGIFQDSISFGSISLSNVGNYDSYVVKYDLNGNVIWAKSIGGSSDEDLYGCSTDANGNIFVTGHFWSANLTIDSSITLINTSSSSG